MRESEVHNVPRNGACGDAGASRSGGSHEFYRDDNGELHPYGHPGAISKEAKEKGVKGFYIRGYCTKCDTVKAAIIREFNTPVHKGWWHIPVNEGKCFKPICDECGTELILDFVEKTCPKCGNIFHGMPIPEFS